jgi:hypothetical protein
MPKLHLGTLIKGIEFRQFGGVVRSGRGGLVGHSMALDVDHDNSPGPCVECPNAARCAGGLACAQFALFIKFGGNERWRATARQPNAKIFAQIYEDKGSPAARARRRREALERAAVARWRRHETWAGRILVSVQERPHE